MASTKAKKQSLTRGIDPIPRGWEFVSSYMAIQGLRRSITTLIRLADAAAMAGDRSAARDLRRVQTACERAHEHITGGFQTDYIQPLARKVNALAARIGAPHA